MSSTTSTTAPSSSAFRYIVIATLIFGAFLGSYRYAAAKSGTPLGGPEVFGATPAANLTGDAAAGGSGCACCGSSAPTENGLTGELSEGVASVEGDVQKISVDLSQGFYEPNQIVLKAGVPTEITFAQGSGCTAQVMSSELGFYEDISGGSKTVKLPALEAGEYPFYCGMQMVFGKIVVK